MSIKVRNLQEKKERVNKIVSDNAKLFGFSSEPAQTGKVKNRCGWLAHTQTKHGDDALVQDLYID